MSISHNPYNILFIMTDQHRFDYLACAGADFIKTPNIDRIAKMGMRFTHCFSNSPICAPARIGLATGLQPCRIGSVNNESYLPLSTPTYYQRLRDYGYRVGCVGKLDLAKPSGYNGRYGDRPCVFSWGFTHPEECEGKMHAGQSDVPRGPYGFYLQERGLYEGFSNDYKRREKAGWTIGACQDSVLSSEDFEDGYIGKQASRWINDISNDFPWHLFVSFVGPHDPYDPPTEYAEKYRNAYMHDPVNDSLEGKPEWIKSRRRNAEVDEIKQTRRQYCAAIELIDSQIGQILDSLEKRELLARTYIIFTSDHGDMLGDHGLYQKSVAYEPSIHVPLIVAGPTIKSDQVSDALVELIDLNSTVCELCGLSEQQNIDARSFADVLHGKSAVHRENIVTRMHNFRCIRNERYKYIENLNDRNELYDLENDPMEINNAIHEHPDIVRELSRALNYRYMEGEWNR